MITTKPAALVVGASHLLVFKHAFVAYFDPLTSDLLQTGAFRRLTTIGRRPVEFPEGSEVPTYRKPDSSFDSPIW